MTKDTDRKDDGLRESVTPAGLRARADIVRQLIHDGESCARHLELAADEIEALRRAASVGGEIGSGAPFCKHVMAPHPNCPKCTEERERPISDTSGEGELRAIEDLAAAIASQEWRGNKDEDYCDGPPLKVGTLHIALKALRSLPSVQPQANGGLSMWPDLTFEQRRDISTLLTQTAGSRTRYENLRNYLLSTPSVQEAAAPIDMILFCPRCGHQHVDKPEQPLSSQGGLDGVEPDAEHWTNPPHKSHLCHNCNFIWRPADVPTNGVRDIRTSGKKDMPYAGAVRAVQESEMAVAQNEKGIGIK